jgi:hypothetical protein
MQRTAESIIDQVTTFRTSNEQKLIFAPIRPFTIRPRTNLKQIKELKSDIDLLKSIGAKDTPTMSGFHSSTAFSTPLVIKNDSLVVEADRLMVMSEQEERLLKQYELDF